MSMNGLTVRSCPSGSITWTVTGRARRNWCGHLRMADSPAAPPSAPALPSTDGRNLAWMNVGTRATSDRRREMRRPRFLGSATRPLNTWYSRIVLFEMIRLDGWLSFDFAAGNVPTSVSWRVQRVESGAVHEPSAAITERSFDCQTGQAGANRRSSRVGYPRCQRRLRADHGRRGESRRRFLLRRRVPQRDAYPRRIRGEATTTEHTEPTRCETNPTETRWPPIRTDTRRYSPKRGERGPEISHGPVDAKLVQTTVSFAYGRRHEHAVGGVEKKKRGREKEKKSLEEHAKRRPQSRTGDDALTQATPARRLPASSERKHVHLANHRPLFYLVFFTGFRVFVDSLLRS